MVQSLEKLQEEHGATMSRYSSLEESYALLEAALARQRAGQAKMVFTQRREP